MMDTVRRAARAHCLIMDWTTRRLQDGPGATYQRSGQDTLNAEGHIACQQGGQATRPLRNKCRDRAA
jgi:hypothetical protein